MNSWMMTWLSLAVAAATPVSAATEIDQTLTLTPGSNVLSATFAKFNSNFGFLLDAHFIFTLNTQFNATNFTEGSNPQPQQIASISGNWVDSVALGAQADSYTHHYSFVPAIHSGPRGYAPVVDRFTASDTGGINLKYSLADYIGGPTDMVDVTAGAFADGNMDHSYTEYFTGYEIGFKYATAFQAGSSVTLRYDYRPIKRSPPHHPPTATPEPAAWMMMVAGFGGVGAALRTRRWAIVATA